MTAISAGVGQPAGNGVTVPVQLGLAGMAPALTALPMQWNTPWPFSADSGQWIAAFVASE